MHNMPSSMQDNLRYMADRGYQPIYTYLSHPNSYDDNNRQCIVHYCDMAGNVAISQYIDGGDVQIQYISYYRLHQMHKVANKKAEELRQVEELGAEMHER